MAATIPAAEPNYSVVRDNRGFLTVRVLRPSQKHCHFVEIKHAHTNTKHARAHKRERERKRKGVSRVAAIEGSSRYERRTRLPAAKACWPLAAGGRAAPSTAPTAHKGGHVTGAIAHCAA